MQRAPAEPSPPEEPTRSPTARRLARRARAAVVLTSLVVAAGASTLWLNGRPGAAPDWRVRVSATGARPVPVLAVGPGVGLQLVRAHPVQSPGGLATEVPAALQAGRVRLLTLGRATIRVDAEPVGEDGTRRLSGRGHVITLSRHDGASRISTF